MRAKSWMKILTMLSATAITAVGCSWDSSKYDTYVSQDDNGNEYVVQCPPADIGYNKDKHIVRYTTKDGEVIDIKDGLCPAEYPNCKKGNIDPESGKSVYTCEACDSGFVNCDGRCIDPSTDSEFCGALEGCSGDGRGENCTQEGMICINKKCYGESKCTLRGNSYHFCPNITNNAVNEYCSNFESTDTCGSCDTKNYNCMTKKPNIADASCIFDSKGYHCVYKSCIAGYTSNGKTGEEFECIKNSCSNDIDCPEYDNAKAICDKEAKCKYTCDEHYKDVSSADSEIPNCINPLENDEHCGELASETLLNCTEDSMICHDGKCKPSCNTDEHEELCTIIENNEETFSCKNITGSDNDNCGDCGVKCNTDLIENSKTVQCELGNCRITECQPDFKIDGNKCIPKACNEGDTLCTDIQNDQNLLTGVIKKCDSHNIYQISSTCTNSCNGNECGECINTLKSCEDDIDTHIGKTKICSFGRWGDSTECIKVSCNKDKTGCGECLNGKTKCQDGKQYTCVDGKWDNEKSCGDFSCDTVKGVCGNCKDGNTFCTSETSDAPDFVKTCTNGNYGSPTNCPSTIDDINSLGACIDSKACGSFKCKSNYSSTETSCVLTDIKCDTPNAQRCIMDNESTTGIIQKCINSQWTTQNNCQGGYSCKDETSCGICINGSSRCNINNDENESDTFDICENGQWSAKGACPISISNALGSCDSTETVCSGFKCKPNYHIEGDICAKNECTNGDTRCINDDNKGKKQICNNNAWVDNESCGDNSCNADESDCGNCHNGAKRCAGTSPDRYQTCVDGAWNIGTECATTCDASTGCATIPLCPPNEMKCDGTCVNVQTSTEHCGNCITSCSVANANNSCVNGSCNYTCQDGFYDNGSTCVSCADYPQCISIDNDNDKLKTCEGGTLKDVDCTTDEPNAYGKCDSTASPNKCDGIKCQSGYTLSGGKCLKPCSSSTTYPKCENDDTSKIGTKYTCNSNGFEAESECSGVSCNGTNCGECLNDSKTCGGNRVKNCVNGHWQSSECSITNTTEGPGSSASATCYTDVDASAVGCKFTCANGKLCVNSFSAQCVSNGTTCDSGSELCFVAHSKRIEYFNGICRATECQPNYKITSEGKCEKETE